MVGMRLFHTYSGIIRYSSFVDLMRVGCALLVGVLSVSIIAFALQETKISLDLLSFTSRQYVLMTLIAMVAMWSFRIFVKPVGFG